MTTAVFHAVMTPGAREAFATAGPGEAACIDCGNGPAQACTGCTRDLIGRCLSPDTRPDHRGISPVCILCGLEAAARCGVCLLYAIVRGRAEITRTGAVDRDPSAAPAVPLDDLAAVLDSVAPARPGTTA